LGCVRGSPEAKRGIDADRHLWSQDAHVPADLILQQLRDLKVAKQPQPSGQLGGDKQCRCESLCRVAGANSPPLFLHKFLDRQHALSLGIQASFQNRPDDFGVFGETQWNQPLVKKARAEAVASD
jgi:hypothetical protein